MSPTKWNGGCMGRFHDGVINPFTLYMGVVYLACLVVNGDRPHGFQLDILSWRFPLTKLFEDKHGQITAEKEFFFWRRHALKRHPYYYDDVDDVTNTTVSPNGFMIQFDVCICLEGVAWCDTAEAFSLMLVRLKLQRCHAESLQFNDGFPMKGIDLGKGCHEQSCRGALTT